MTDDATELRDRLARLELENAALRARRPLSTRVRGAVAGVLIVLALIIAPVAALGTWVRAQLVDTDRFVATFSPLATSPDVQDFLGEKIVVAIDDAIDIEAVVGDVADGIRDLGLPPRAETALGLLQGSAADGIRSLISGAVDDVLASPQFAGAWEQALRFTHANAVAAIQNDPTSSLSIRDGALALDLAPLVAAVKTELTDRGMPFAAMIPDVERSVTLVESDTLTLVQTVYQLAVAAGYWLPWLVLAMLIGGVVLARDRRQATAWTGFGLTLSFGLALIGIDIGRMLTVAALSPAVMPRGAAEAVFDIATVLMIGTLVSLAVLGAIIAVVAWFLGGGRYATSMRRTLDRLFARARDAADRNGIGTGPFGRAVDRWRSALLVIAVLGALLWLMLARPLGVGTILTVFMALGAFAVVVELVRRPAVALEEALDEE